MSSSSPRIAWLMAEGETPSRLAGLRKTAFLRYGEERGENAEIVSVHL